MPQIDVLANEVWASGRETGKEVSVLVSLGMLIRMVRRHSRTRGLTWHARPQMVSHRACAGVPDDSAGLCGCDPEGIH